MGNSLAPRIQNAEKTGVLQLSDISLKKIPDAAKNLDCLRTLDISKNKFEAIDAWIMKQKQLKVLKCDENRLRCFPVELSILTKLETLSAANNLISSLTPPGCITNFAALIHLRVVNLSNNCLTEFPVEFCSATIPLDLLDLKNNRIGMIPSCVSLLQAVELNANNNQISVVAETIAKCPRLRVLRMQSNQITLENLPVQLLSSSPVALLEVENNHFNMKSLHALPEYAKYTERYTAMKKKTT